VAGISSSPRDRGFRLAIRSAGVLELVVAGTLDDTTLRHYFVMGYGDTGRCGTARLGRGKGLGGMSWGMVSNLTGTPVSPQQTLPRSPLNGGRMNPLQELRVAPGPSAVIVAAPPLS